MITNLHQCFTIVTRPLLKITTFGEMTKSCEMRHTSDSICEVVSDYKTSLMRKKLPPINIIHQFFGHFSGSALALNPVANPVNQVVLERPFYELMQKIGGE